MSRVSVEIENHIAKVTLTRGDKMNAVDPAMAKAIVEAGEGLIGNADIRAVVLSGEGRAFCAGLDVASFRTGTLSDPALDLAARRYGTSNLMQRVATVWRDVPVPVIAALHGAAFGAGFQLALGADIRIAAPDAKLAVMEMKWGLVPDMGGMVLMPRLMRSDVIRLLTYTAEPVAAQRGLGLGMVSELAEDPLARAMELAAGMAQRSPSAMRAAKALIAFAESGADEAEVLVEETRAQVALIDGADQREVIAANMEGRAPKFA